MLCKPDTHLRISGGYGAWADISRYGHYAENVNLSTARALAARRDWLEATPPAAPSYYTYQISDAGRAAVAAAQKKEGE